MSRQWIGRVALWCLTIFLASFGGAALHSALYVPEYSADRGPLTFFGLACALTAAAIYSRKLR